jgi:KipI family sensor histidine kinase inhibitor
VIYDEPRVLPAGDRCILVELATESSIRVNVRALELADRLAEAKLDAVIDILPMFVSLLVHYDSTRIEQHRLVETLRALAAEVDGHGEIERSSRLIEIPVCYRDPWTRACVEDYAARIAPKEPNPEFVARINGLDGPEQLVRVHSSTQHWVGGVGFSPGLPDLIPLDPRSVLSVPKYDPPRVWTPERSIGVGGGFTSIYSRETPGGYYLIGRTPVPIYDSEQRNDAFAESPALFRVGDRVKFRPIDVDEYREIEARLADGTYVYNVLDYESFSVDRYERWVERVRGGRRF